MKLGTLLLLLPLLTIAFLAGEIRAQTDGVDNTYAPSLGSHLPDGPAGEYLQPNGEFVVFGNFTHVGNTPLQNVARFGFLGNVNGSLACRDCDFTVTSVIWQSDGKVVAAGYKRRGDSITPKTIRINTNGVQDTTFADPWSGMAALPGQNMKANVFAIQADGKIYATLLTDGASIADTNVYRLNTNGTLDGGFAMPVFNGLPGTRQFVAGISVLADGRVFVYGNTPYGALAKINTDGSNDTANFNPPVLTFPAGPAPGDPVLPYINSFGVQADGKYLFTGQFDTVNGIAKSWVARLNSNAALDTSYTPSLPFTTAGNKLVSIVDGDKAIFIRREAGKKIVRFNSDGAVDSFYSAPDQITNVVRAHAFPSGKVLLYGEPNNSGVNEYIKLDAAGSSESFFNPVIYFETSVRFVHALPNGKSIVIGNFTEVNGVYRHRFARLNADGSADTTFDPGAAIESDALIRGISVQADGKLLLAGNFTTYNGVNRPYIVRINLDGSIDTGFNPAIAPSAGLESVAVRPDGKIMIGGYFQSIDSTPRTGVASLNSDGTLDTSFAVTMPANQYVSGFVFPAAGKMVVVGGFETINGVQRYHLARLNYDGSVDPNFSYNGDDYITKVEQTVGGKFFVKGLTVQRLKSDGAVDVGFTWPTALGSARSMAPLVDGTVLVSSYIGPNFPETRRVVTRLSLNGSIDPLFRPNVVTGTLPNSTVVGETLSTQPDGRVLLGGNFIQIGGQARTGLARLVQAPFVRVTPFDFDGDGRADVSVTRPTDFWWHVLSGINYNYSAVPFGSPGDKVVAADYDGDGKTDHAIFRPSTGDWWWLGSADGQAHYIHWGTNGDVPVVGDFSGDGKSDVGVRRNGNNWFIATTSGVMIDAGFYGNPGDIPVIGDYDGSGTDDVAVFRPSTGEWFSRALGVAGVRWGISTDIPVPADYDGDGETDLAVFRPSEGNWYIRYSSTGGFFAMHFGLNGDKPVPADYDGDGQADLAVFRPSDGYWYFLRTTDGFTGFPWGLSTDIPAPAAYQTAMDPLLPEPRPSRKIEVMRQ